VRWYFHDDFAPDQVGSVQNKQGDYMNIAKSRLPAPAAAHSASLLAVPAALAAEPTAGQIEVLKGPRSALCGRNVLDEEYLAEVIPAPEFGGSFAHDAPGLSYGLDVNFKF
jgi:hypothetical protein